MLDQDKHRFAEIYRGVCATYGREANKEAMRLAWNVLLPYSIEQVSQAYSMHLTTSQFMPVPAHINELINASNPALKRPGPDEAWMKTPTEELSYWATDEMLGAWGVVADEMHSDRPDRIAARMAFKDAYTRLVESAKAQGRPVHWQLVRGTTKDNLEDTIREGQRLGYLSPEDANQMLRIECDSAKPMTWQPLIEGAKASGNDVAISRLAELKGQLSEPPPTHDLDAVRAECEARDRALEDQQAKQAAS